MDSPMELRRKEMCLGNNEPQNGEFQKLKLVIKVSVLDPMAEILPDGKNSQSGIIHSGGSLNPSGRMDTDSRVF